MGNYLYYNVCIMRYYSIYKLPLQGPRNAEALPINVLLATLQVKPVVLAAVLSQTEHSGRVIYRMFALITQLSRKYTDAGA